MLQSIGLTISLNELKKSLIMVLVIFFFEWAKNVVGYEVYSLVLTSKNYEKIST